MKCNATLLCLLLAISANLFTDAKAKVDVPDSLALVDLYNSTDGGGWSNHANWLTTMPLSTWYGVTVSGTRVTKLNLSVNALFGILPASIGNLSGLDTLSLDFNYLNGVIPAAIGGLTNLQYLNLQSNNLSDSIPDAIGNLANLQYLNLNANLLTGSLPASIGNLIQLQNLDMGFNQLSGSIPASLGNLSNLKLLILWVNELSGVIPGAISNLTNLTYLDAGTNQLSGAIPASFGNLAKLAHLDLSANVLDGDIPADIGNLTNLDYLDFSFNKLTGSIPSSIGNLINLTTLYIQNDQLSGAIPAAIGNLVKLEIVRLNVNQLSSIPASISNLKKLSSLNLSNNVIGDTIPSSIGNLPMLQYLFLNNNQFTGSIPNSFRNLKSLTYLDLRYNQLTEKNNVDHPLMLPKNDLTAYISFNKFTFNGLEWVSRGFANTFYSPQAHIPVHQQGNTLYVNAGGTLSNNTYKWFKTGTAGNTIIKGDSAFSPAQSGKYYVQVTNAIATKLTLYSDTISFVMNNITANNRIAANENSNGSNPYFKVSPNPASSNINVQIKGTATISLTTVSGKVVLTKTINNNAVLNVSNFANGIYYIQNKTTGEILKIVICKFNQ